jgi:hypothetical protein
MKKQVPKTYHAAPLPFQGQKRNFVAQYRAALKEFKEEHEIDTVVDLFGGSGLLSHVSKRDYPELRVIYNDFDNYHLRIQNVRATNALLTSIRTVLKDYPGDRKISAELSREVLRIIKQEEDSGCFVDYITLSSSLLFSLNYALNYEKLSSETLYNKVRKSDYNTEG